MELKLQKWGNSIGIRIPANILKDLKLKKDDTVIIDKDDDKIIISIPKKECLSLADRFKQYHGENLAKEFEWDEPVGREIW